MKKQYRKPTVLFEDFTLMDSISRICDSRATLIDGITPSNQDEVNCTAYDGNYGLALFVSANSSCVPVDAYEHPSWSYFGSM